MAEKRKGKIIEKWDEVRGCEEVTEEEDRRSILEELILQQQIPPIPVRAKCRECEEAEHVR